MQLADATVLVVDDEEALQEMFSAWVEREGATVLRASNGAEALQLTRSAHVDLVLTDIRMPMMDGITFAKELKKSGKYTPKMVFVSGFSDLTLRDAFDLGVEEFLPKPIRRKPLIAKLQECLLDREHIWHMRRNSSEGATIRRSYGSLASALDGGEIGFGRGGFSFCHTEGLEEGEIVDLCLEFREENHTLRGQGLVRWVAREDGCCGIELLYVEDEDRDWVLGLTRLNRSLSYIPATPSST